MKIINKPFRVFKLTFHNKFKVSLLLLSLISQLSFDARPNIKPSDSDVELQLLKYQKTRSR